MSDNSQENKWIEVLRRELLGKEEMPPDDLWLRIKTQLDKNPTRRYIRSVINWIPVAATVILLVIATTVMLILEPNSSGIEEPKPKKIEVNSIHAASSSNTSGLLSSKTSSFQQAEIAKVDSVSTKTKNELVENFNSKTVEKHSFNKLQIVKETINIQHSSLSDQIASNLLVPSTLEISAALLWQSNELSEFYDNPTPTKNKIGLGTQMAWFRQPGSESSFDQSAYETSLTSAIAIPTEGFAKEFGSGDNLAAMERLAQQELNQLQLVENIATGFQFAWTLKPKFQIESGVFVQRVQLVAPLGSIIYDQSQNRFISALEALPRIGTTDLSVWPLNQNAPTYQFKNWYIQVPLNISTLIGDGRLQFKVVGGLSWHQLVSSRNVVSSSLFQSELKQQLFSPQYVSMQVGSGFFYHLSNQLGLFIEPCLQQPLSSMLNKRFIDYRPISVFLVGGIQYFLNHNLD